jgi:hypothetical protein
MLAGASAAMAEKIAEVIKFQPSIPEVPAKLYSGQVC